MVIQNIFKKINKMLFVLIGLILLLSIFVGDTFLTSRNIMNVLRQIAVNAVLATGATFVIISGGMDLSVGSILAVGGICMGIAIKSEVPVIPAIIIGLLAGSILGLINGLVIAITKIPPFVATLSMMTIGRGLSYILCDGKPITNIPTQYLFLGQGAILGIPAQVWLFAVVALIAGAILKYTNYGRELYFLGGNEEASRFSGVNTRKIKIVTYCINGMLAGLAGVLLTLRTSSAMPEAGEGYEMNAIAAVVIGGCSLAGGKGTMIGTIIGALILGIVNNGMNLLGVTQYMQLVVKGLIIMAAVIIDVASTSRFKAKNKAKN